LKLTRSRSVHADFFRPPTLEHFQLLCTQEPPHRSSIAVQSILKVFLNIPDSKIPWDGITVGYFRLFSTTYQIIRHNSVEWYYRRMTFRFPLAEHWSSYYCELICLRKTLTSFTVEPFNIYFEDLMWLFTHLCRLDKQVRRLKISLPWHLTSSLKTFTVESNILTNIFVLSTIATHSNDYFAHKNLRLREISDTGTPGWR
jgi:hypothetical protein